MTRPALSLALALIAWPSSAAADRWVCRIESRNVCVAESLDCARRGLGETWVIDTREETISWCGLKTQRECTKVPVVVEKGPIYLRVSKSDQLFSLLMAENDGSFSAAEFSSSAIGVFFGTCSKEPE